MDGSKDILPVKISVPLIRRGSLPEQVHEETRGELAELGLPEKNNH